MYHSLSQSMSVRNLHKSCSSNPLYFVCNAVSHTFCQQAFADHVFIVKFSNTLLRCSDYSVTRCQCPMDSKLICCRPTSRGSSGNNMNNNGGLQVGIADDQAKDFDFEKTEMKYDSTGMFHWGPAKNLEECILVSWKLVMS